MRCVSKYRNWSTTVIPQDEESIVLDGKATIRTIAPVEAAFRWFDITDWEIKEAVEKLGPFKGLNEGEDPRFRLSTYDTDQAAEEQGWTAAQKASVENRLRTHPYLGINFIIVEKPKVEAPYPSYVKQTTTVGKRTIEHVLEALKQKVVEDGHNPDSIVEFETRYPRKESAEIIAAMRELVEEPKQAEPVIAA